MFDSENFRITKYSVQKQADSNKHYHPYYELLYIRSGNINYFIDDEITNVSSNSVVFINKNTIHKASRNKDYCKYFLINFSDKFVSDSFKDNLHLLFKNHTVTLGYNEYMYISILFSKLHHEFTDKENFYEDAIYYEFNDLLIMLSRIVENKYINSQPKMSAIENATAYITHSINSGNFAGLDLASISHMFAMSPSCFSKKFKTETGLGFKEYIILKKILLAKKLIETTKLSITNIAFQSGFTDSNYFSSVFKKIEDIPPSQYAKMVRSFEHQL